MIAGGRIDEVGTISGGTIDEVLTVDSIRRTVIVAQE